MKNRSFIFSVVASLMTIAFFFIVNFTTSWSHPWFIYPTFVILWWPLAMFFSQNRKWKVFAVIGSLMIAGFLYLVNIITSPAFLWSIFPIFAVLWWPLSMIICGAKRYKLYSIVMSLLTIGFFFVVNYWTSWQHPWFIYPAFAILWWPISMIICGAKRYKLYSVVSSLYIIGFFALINWVTTPHITWFYYIAYPVLWWPLSMFLGKKKTIRLYSVVMSLLSVGYLALINLQQTPDRIWFVYTIFYFLWWPIAMFLRKRAATTAFAVVSAIAIIVYHYWLYTMLTPGGHPWYLYLIFPAIWWPVCMANRNRLDTKAFSYISLLACTVYYMALNIILSPTYLWVINVIYLASWGVMGLYFGSRRRFFALSVCATIVTAVYFVLLNWISSPYHIWAVYPIFAVIWWPLSMYFFRVRKQRKQKAIESQG